MPRIPGANQLVSTRQSCSGPFMLLTAPFSTPRSVMNIVGNGPQQLWVVKLMLYERDRAIDKGMVINGVILGGDDELKIDQLSVSMSIGGPRSLVFRVRDADDMVEVMSSQVPERYCCWFAVNSSQCERPRSCRFTIPPTLLARADEVIE